MQFLNLICHLLEKGWLYRRYLVVWTIRIKTCTDESAWMNYLVPQGLTFIAMIGHDTYNLANHLHPLRIPLGRRKFHSNRFLSPTTNPWKRLPSECLASTTTLTCPSVNRCLPFLSKSTIPERRPLHRMDLLPCTVCAVLNKKMNIIAIMLIILTYKN